jgi:signal transduction histidine kinase
MRERVQLHSGLFSVRESSSGGTSVVVELPIQLRAIATSHRRK